MKIELTQNKETDVGPRDYKYLNQWSWHYLKDSKGKGGYAARKENDKAILMHRVILERIGYKNFQKSDHIDRNKLNNLRSNLRPATNRQSACNCGKQSNNTSGYIGVSYDKERRKWRAYIRVNKKTKHLGLFNSKVEAAKIYNKAAKKYHGKFAVLNEV